MSVRFEIFPAALSRAVDFYSRVLGFELVRDERDSAHPYVSLRRDEEWIGAAQRAREVPVAARRPPVGVEIVLEVDDVQLERQRVARVRWPVDEDLVDRPWGPTYFRVCDPDGHYLRVTSRPAADGTVDA